jgi:arabinose operon protein AraL
MATPEHLYNAYIFDLDGTLYLGEEFLPGVRDTLEFLQGAGCQLAFLSNNPTRTCQDYAAKLTRLGFRVLPEQIVNSSLVMVNFLNRWMPGARLLVLGEEPLCRELISAGFVLTSESDDVDAVIASFDRTFTYNKLQAAFDAIRAGAHFFATNADRYCPVPGGGEPDAAAIIAAVEACTNHVLEAMVGKPSRYMLKALLELTRQPVEACLIVGDRLETDVQMGLNAGMDAALVLTGATDETSLTESPIQPTFVLRQLSDVIPSILAGRQGVFP